MNRSLKMKRSAAMMFVVMITVFVPFAEAWAGQFPTASGGTGSSTDPYQIKTIEDLNKLAVDVNNGTTYEGVYFKVMNDIDFNDDATLKPTTAWNLTEATEENNFTRIGYWTGSASTNRPFLGHFDGDGKTIRGIRIYKIVDTQADNYQGLFGWIGSGAEVKNVILDDARIVCGHNSGGIVGQNSGGTIEGCQVTAKVAVFGIHSSGTTHCLGGIVGRNDTEDSTVKNCTSSVTIGVIGETKCRHCGGIVGYNNGSVTDNFVIGATIPGAALNNHGAIAGSNHNNGTLQRNYYNACTIAGVKNATSKGCSNADVAANDGALPVFSLTLATGITTTATPAITVDGVPYFREGTEVILSGGQTAPPVGIIYEGYIVNGSLIDVTSFTMPAQNTSVASNAVSVYSLTLATGITTTATPATTVDGVPYFREGTEITLSGQPANVEEGYICPYIVDGTTIIGNTFIMPTNDVNVAFGDKTDDWLYVYDGNSEATAYQIRNTDHLDMLAQRVNSGTTFEGKYFKLMNDIGYAPTTAWDDETSTESNYTAIGTYDNRFKGHFNGNGKTISGIRIYSTDNYQGLFGVIDGEAKVSGVTLSDTRITAASNTGGIVGYYMGDNISDCNVTANVALCVGQDYAEGIGGIVGYNSGTVKECTSSVTITVASGISGCRNFGGIVGYGGVLYDSHAIGANVAAVSNAGAIMGFQVAPDQYAGNTYHSCLVGSNAFNIGTNSGDHIGTYLAALDATALYLDDRKDNTALIAAYADPASHTANDGNVPNLNNLTVTLVREFKKDVCSIVCLPFDCTPASDIGSFYAFDGMENTGNGYVPTMTTDNQVTMLTANTPYLFMPAATGEVTLSGTKGGATPITAGEAVSGDWKLIGSYARKTWTATETGTSILDANGALTAVTNGTTIRPTYGYFVSTTVVAFGTCGSNLTWELKKNGQKEGGEPTYRLTITGSGAMTDYYYSAPWQPYSEAITEVSLPNGLTRVGETAFNNCIALTTVIIPSSVTTIGKYAFQSCGSLSAVNFSEDSQLTEIGRYAFYGTALTTVTIPASVTTIGEYVFYNSCLSSVNFTEGSQLTTIGDGAFYGTGLTTVTIPASVTTIGEYVFYNSCLSSVNFTEGSQLTTIGNNSFNGTGLTTVTIPASVTTIGESAFYSCSSLSTVNFAEGSQLTTIGGYAFYGTALTTVTIPASVTTIVDGAFWGCGSLTTVNVMSATPPTLESYAFYFDCACTFNVRSAAYLTADGWKDVANKTGDYNGKNFTMNVISALTLDEGISTSTAPTVSYEGAGYYAEGTVVALTATPPEGYTVSFTAKDAGNNDITATVVSGSTLTMPAKDVTVSATILRDMSDLFADGNQWTGYVAQEDLALPDGLTAYVVTALGETTATATAIDYIPQGEPVLLCRSDKTVNSYAASAYTGSGSAPSGNLLKVASGTNQPRAYQDYVLYKDAFVLTSGGTLATGKVYLPVPSANASRAVARAIVTDDGETTGMEDVRWQMEEGSGDWYSIDGRKLNGKPAKKGLYIHKGKKVVR